MQAPELSRKMTKLIKSENTAIGAHEAAGRERIAIAAQLSEWGESTEDDNVSDISDKLGVLLAEIGEQEDSFAQNLEDYRRILKQVRDMEASVQPSREQRQKITDEIAKLKYKDPNSPRLVTLEHELVRAEAQNLVAEAQLSNIVRLLLISFCSCVVCKVSFGWLTFNSSDSAKAQGGLRYPSGGRY
jgi:small-conductance mechanosensitive channel